MDDQFLMANSGALTRTEVPNEQDTHINDRLLRSLRLKAMQQALAFYTDYFAKPAPSADLNDLVDEYDKEAQHAKTLGLFAPWGIREKDHLNLWCLGRVFNPDIYIESGVFIGSSLHAYLKCPSLKKVIAIDPNLKSLKVPEADIPGGELIDDKDFSQLQIDGITTNTLAYFDDHINSAQRVCQSHEKGVKHLLFDDSTGLEGVVQRLYPAIPTLPMIMNRDAFQVGDELTWTFANPLPSTLKNRIQTLISDKEQKSVTQVCLRVTQAMIDECEQAGRLIKRCVKIPDLGQFIPQTIPEPLGDSSKYLVELN